MPGQMPAAMGATARDEDVIETPTGHQGALVLIEERAFPWGTGYVLNADDGRPIYTTDKRLFDENEGVRKWKIGVSVCSGCLVGCIYCFTNTIEHYRPLSAYEIVQQVYFVIDQALTQTKIQDDGRSLEELLNQYDVVKVSMKQMGDPLTNRNHTLAAIKHLDMQYKQYGFQFVISTAGPKNHAFFEKLKALRTTGTNIRLQISLHTTDEGWRVKLSPKLPMMKLADISEVVHDWYVSPERVTLTFVPIAGVPLSAARLAEVFNPQEVFIKISYLDPNPCTEALGLENIPEHEIETFINEIDRYGFSWAKRKKYPKDGSG